MTQTIAEIARAVLGADVSLFKLVNGHHSALLDAFFLGVSFLGNGWVVIPLFFAFIIWRTPKSRRWRVVLFAAAVFLIGGVANTIVKRAVDRPRPSAYFMAAVAGAPSETARSFDVHVVQDRLVAHSFPSGHANTAFTVAALLVLACGIRFWPAFLGAGLVAYSRVYMGAHFPLDTFIGAAMGVGFAFAVWHGLTKIAPLRGQGAPRSSRSG